VLMSMASSEKLEAHPELRKNFQTQH
jgi:hypothetical protein